ncbi:hypothetical protein LAZ40_01395 [Cereibacter sphaeroides]|uniref:beta strand repeat-containing protein n=1 Tax=Cereibacter sphaeroides TaxID=1063 RepID=UPI001F2D875D|nr:hypothetical protein [Cereibacter sphaeroides]MCE6957714.1 hypothetical protein [Cereibacter sphaeroides]
MPIDGITLPASVTVSGDGSPMISIAGGAWTTSGTVSDGQTIAVRLTSDPGTNGGSNTATVNVAGVTAGFTVTTIDTTPNAFSFAEQSNVVMSEFATSGTVTISGITAPASVQVTGEGSPQIQVGTGTWATTGTISNGQTLRVRLTASDTALTEHVASVSVGSVSKADFAVTTGSDVPDAFDIAPVVRAPMSSTVTSASVTLTGMVVPVPVSVTGDGAPQISINGGTWASTGTISAGQSLRVRLTSSDSTLDETVATVNANGMLSDFSVTTGSDVPADFVFTPVNGAPGNSLITSNSVTMAAMSLPGNVSVTGDGAPQVSINGSTTWVTSGTISNGQSLRVRLTSDPGTNGGLQTATVDVSGITSAFKVTTIDTTPAAYAFTTKSAQLLNTLVTSNTVTISGLGTSVPVSVTGDGSPRISINGSTTWVTSGTISNGDTLAVRLTSSLSQQTTSTATVSVGSVDSDFDVITGDAVPGSIVFASVGNAAGDTVITSAAATMSGMTIPAAVSISGAGSPQFQIGSGAWGTSGTISNGQTLRVRLTSVAGTAGGSRTATVTVGGKQAGFTVTTIDRTPADFSFTTKSGVALSTDVTSASVTITGLTASTSVSVTGSGSPEIQTGTDTWATSGSISNGETLKVRLTSAGTVSTSRTATVTVGGVSRTFTVTTGTNVPAAYAFTTVTNASSSTLYTSNTVTMSGMTLPGTVSVSGSGSPKVSINGGAFGSGGTITNGQTLRVQLTSASGTSGTSNVATVNVSGRTATYTVKTRDTVPNAFSFTSQTGVPLDTVRNSNTVTISGLTTNAPVSVSGTGDPEISIGGGSWVKSGTISNGQTLQVRQTSSAVGSTARIATVTVGGLARTFSVTTLARQGPGVIQLVGSCFLGTGAGQCNPGPEYFNNLYTRYADGSCGPIGAYSQSRTYVPNNPMPYLTLTKCVAP